MFKLNEHTIGLNKDQVIEKISGGITAYLEHLKSHRYFMSSEALLHDSARTRGNCSTQIEGTDITYEGLLKMCDSHYKLSDESVPYHARLPSNDRAAAIALRIIEGLHSGDLHSKLEAYVYSRYLADEHMSDEAFKYTAAENLVSMLHVAGILHDDTKRVHTAAYKVLIGRHEKGYETVFDLAVKNHWGDIIKGLHTRGFSEAPVCGVDLSNTDKLWLYNKVPTGNFGVVEMPAA